jgi:nicotinamidase-related amidase
MPADPLRGHDRVPAGAALLIIDMFNRFDFDGGAALGRKAAAIAEVIARLRRRLDRHDVPTIYCNDNFGQWRSDFRELVGACSADGMRGALAARALEPRRDDYFVLKPRHSAFFGTPLHLLLRTLHVRCIVLTGLSGDRCILASAIDAHMHGYSTCVASDAIASETPARNARALRQMAEAFDVGVRRAASIDGRYLAGRASAGDVV